MRLLILAAIMFAFGILLAGDPGGTTGQTCTNDDFDCATQVGALPFVDPHGPVASATAAPDDPAPALHQSCTNVGAGNFGHTVWYRFAPSYDVVVDMTTQGSNYDTVLAVFTGGPGSFTAVACNDNAGAIAPQSALSLEANAGATYHVMVAGSGNSNGDLTFSVSVRCFILALQANPPSGGNPTADPTESGGSCNLSGQFFPGAQTVIKAGTKAGQTFYGWTGDPGCSGAGDVNLTMSASKTCIANFVPIPTPTPPPTPTASPSPSPTPTLTPTA